MKRSAPLKRTPLRRGDSVLERRTGIAPVNRARKKKLHERNFGEYADIIRALPCDTCGAPAPSDPSHAVPRGMGGCGGDKTTLFPQCRPCHRAYEAHETLTREEAKARAAHYWRKYGAAA